MISISIITMLTITQIKGIFLFGNLDAIKVNLVDILNDDLNKAVSQRNDEGLDINLIEDFRIPSLEGNILGSTMVEKESATSNENMNTDIISDVSILSPSPIEALASVVSTASTDPDTAHVKENFETEFERGALEATSNGSLLPLSPKENLGSQPAHNSSMLEKLEEGNVEMGEKEKKELENISNSSLLPPIKEQVLSEIPNMTLHLRTAIEPLSRFEHENVEEAKNHFITPEFEVGMPPLPIRLENLIRNLSSGRRNYSNSRFQRFFNLSESVPNMYQALAAFCSAQILLSGGCCTCLGDCLIFEKCCALSDWVGRHPNTSEIKNKERVVTTVQAFLSSTKKRTHEKCETLLPPSLAQGHKSRAYYMVTSCTEKEPEAEEKCESLDFNQTQSFFPVIDKDGTLYRNVFCAVCNKAKEFFGVGMKLKCRNDKGDRDCFYSLDFVDSSAALCFTEEDHNIVGNCPKKHPLYDLCVQYDTEDTREVNYYCQLCIHGYEPPLEQYIDSGCMTWYKKIYPIISFYCYNLHNHRSSNIKCIYPFDCPLTYINQGDGCRKIQSDGLRSYMFDNCLRKKGVKLFFVNPKGYDEIRNLFHPFELPQLIVLRPDNSTLILRTKTFLSNKVKDLISHLRYSNETIIVHPDENSLAFNSHFSPPQIFSKKRLCAVVKDIWLDKEAVIKTNCDVSYMGQTIPFDDVLSWVNIKKSIINRHLSICTSFYLPLDQCRLHIINGTEVELLSNLSIVHNHRGRKNVYKPAEYVPLVENNFGICKPTASIKVPSWHDKISSLEIYLTIFGSLINTIIYLLIVTLLCLIKEIQSHHHFCILVLCINFTLEDISYFIMTLLKFHGVSLFETHCKIFGIVQHFTSLFKWFWLTFFAASLSKDITSNQIESVRVEKCLILSAFLTIVFVATGVIFSELEILDAKYDNTIGCYHLGGFYSRFLLQFIPSLFCILTLLGLMSCFNLFIKREKGTEGFIKSQFTSLIILVVFIGFVDVSNFMQVPGTVSASSKITTMHFNIVFAFAHASLKSMRGFVILLIVFVRKDFITICRLRFLRAKDMIREKPGRSQIKTTVDDPVIS